MKACKTAPPDRRDFGKRVGDNLLKRHGKKRFYTIDQVRDSVVASQFPLDWDCWAFSLFTSRQDFDSYHRAMGKVCDYSAMRGEMIGALTDTSFSLFDLDLSWLEWPDIDLSGIFDFFDFN